MASKDLGVEPINPVTEPADPTHINLDLDTIEREQVRGVPQRKPAFIVKVDGKPLVFKDPLDIDAVILMTMEDSPARFFRATLSDEPASEGETSDFEHMVRAFETPGKISGLKLRALMQGYRVHYGLDDVGNGVGSRR